MNVCHGAKVQLTTIAASAVELKNANIYNNGFFMCSFETVSQPLIIPIQEATVAKDHAESGRSEDQLC